MHIVYVSDGKAGHRSQALGLYQAMQRQAEQPLSFQEVFIQDLPLFALFTAFFKNNLASMQQQPNYIIGVGSHTQLRVLMLSKIYPQAKTIILMKPNYPLACFDFAVIPQHDAVIASERVLISQGALNPIVNQQRHQAGRILIALGGSSKRHQWNSNKVMHALAAMVEENPQSMLILTTSRRTPADFLKALSTAEFATQLQIFPVEETAQGWIFEQMQLAEAVWVTEDSVSMIFEALTAGCRVGLIEIDRLKQDRITHAVDQLLESKVLVKHFNLNQLAAPISLNEADRIAKLILA